VKPFKVSYSFSNHYSEGAVSIITVIAKYQSFTVKEQYEIIAVMAQQ
jgi:hypothetical protein